MKRRIFLVGFGIVLSLAVAAYVLHILIGLGVKENIEAVQEKYPGNAEDALISYLLDEKNCTDNRTHTAIWTLGQIQSEKALPILREFSKDDPKGKTCHGSHNSVLCQYEIHKAIVAIEKGRLFSYARLKHNY